MNEDEKTYNIPDEDYDYMDKYEGISELELAATKLTKAQALIAKLRTTRDILRDEILATTAKNAILIEALKKIKNNGCDLARNDPTCHGCIAHDALTKVGAK